MAFLNKEERDALLDEIKDLKFNQIKGRLRGKDPKNRLAYYRNVQRVNEWTTRYVLPTLGTQVTLVENLEVNEAGKTIVKTDYHLVEIIVEPTPENRT